jgi:hypothetical protein
MLEMGKGTNNVDIQPHLAPSEKVLSVFGPFYATSHRVVRLDAKNGPSRGYLLEIPYHELTSVELMRQPNHPLMVLGAFIILLGFFLTGILYFSSIFAILVGGAILFGGARGKPGYYQIYAREMPRHAERYWQVEYNRSGSFIATVRSVIGQMPDF